MSDSTAQKIIDKIKDSSNVLVTVNTNPSLDELSAALAMTLVINKLDKHATAVFSGDIPSAIEFLKPEKTFESTVDSLRDFIISLDKEKADHLRYKVVDDMVKIFITPYRTTISDKDLDFSQGDYNVELVLAIGVRKEDDLDRALASHGKILHDATVASVSLGEPSNLGGIEWVDAGASSYSEMLVALAEGLRGEKALFDEQISNAFLTGIVAATNRFSNDRTSSKTMTVAAQLMSSGANQQLIATKLEDDHQISAPKPKNISSNGDMKDGELNKIQQADALKPKNDNASEASSSSKEGTGALLVSHEPEGTVEEVSEAVATEKSGQALARAEEEIENQTKAVADQDQADAAEAAEKQLADQLTTLAPAANVPSVADLQKDIAEANDDIEATTNQPIVESILPPVAPILEAPAPQESRIDTSSNDAPSMGGTLNATTEQAEEDKRRQIDSDRNKTILSHGGGSYATAAPAFQSPINAASDIDREEPEVKDIFADGSETSLTSHAEVIQPPSPSAPVLSAPTLADIEAQTKAAHTDARAAIDAALATEPAFTPLGAPLQAPEPLESSLPPLPPLPPMPDFTSLPPLSAPSTPFNTATVPDTLGDMLPPAASAQPTQPTDPGQFRIPGQ